MKLTKLKLYNYRSYGESEQIINFDELTALIGNNSSGKTAALNALNTIFSENSNDRNLERSDFFLPKDKAPEELEEQSLYIETIFHFNELQKEQESITYAIPTFFDSFVVDAPGHAPYLRIRLEATWKKSSNIEGSIESKVYYITCPETAEIEEENKRPASRHDINRIRMIYVPAVRDPSKQLKNASGSMLYQIMNSINWKDSTKESIKGIIQDLNDEFLKESGVSILKNAVHDEWEEYHSDSRYSNAQLRFNSTNIESAIKKTEVLFSPSVTEREFSIDEMGDGLRSLFYISMVDSMLDVENKIRDEIEKGKELSFSKTPPILTIVAVEEPENHIAPHLLGKLIGKLRDISKKCNAQTLLTSHSPAIVKRISPEELRYFRLIPNTLSTEIRHITLPDKEKISDQYKYVKEAVKAYPEIYFAKLVILGEGDSEEILLPKFLEIDGDRVDSSGISIVPLGGRHVNHFWRLLNDLKIPHITLLDLDRERDGGGWGRIKYVLKQLIENGYDKEELLEVSEGVLTDEELDEMNTWDVKLVEDMNSWIKFLEKYNIFFSSPLDIDFLMLENFEEEYKAILSKTEGPRIRKKDEEDKNKTIMIQDIESELSISPEYQERITCDVQNTLKECGGEGVTYSDQQKKLMVWYNYFFLNRGKPSTHISVLSQLDDSNLAWNIPNVISRLIVTARKLLK